MTTGGILLYDCKRDGNIREGETLLVYDTGRTELIRRAKLKGDTDVRIGAKPQKPGTFRSRLAGDVKHRKAHARQPAIRKRVALRKIDGESQGVLIQ